MQKRVTYELAHLIGHLSLSVIIGAKIVKYDKHVSVLVLLRDRAQTWFTAGKNSLIVPYKPTLCLIRGHLVSQ